ncbi:ABC transporter D family member 2 [Rhynchospora pubera]|uniref:ABC transporter D family member 2 n=1 Tax=Rhynchospora pubera TaxID=906938 RepID=A0AAV8CAM2_9POAL|nr:ABC transporter D family member 2 [Rhynchospora pubera]
MVTLTPPSTDCLIHSSNLHTSSEEREEERGERKRKRNERGRNQIKKMPCYLITTLPPLSHFTPNNSLSSPRRFCFSHASSSRIRLAKTSLPLTMRRRRGSRRSRSATASDESVASVSTDDDKRVGPDVATLLRRFWKVAAPYWSSEDKVQARLRLAAVFALTLGTTGISVGFNFLGRDFYNALANKDQEQFMKQLLYYLGGFATGIPFFVLRDYARETLSLRWRSWMTTYYMKRYFKNRTFYKIQSQSIIDNPDQRIVDDLSAFTGTALSFSLTFFNAAIDLISFSNILYGIYPPLFVVLIVYSLGGTAISIFLGKGLVNLNFMQEKKEADFRYGLVRVRENAESIAFYGGEENELQLLIDRFKRAFENLSELLISSRNLEFFTNGYRYIIQVLPAAVVAPMFFSGKIEFGVINQSVSAFNHILSDFSLIVYQFQAISAFSAVIDRLGEFDDLLDGNESSILSKHESTEGIKIAFRELWDPLSSNGSTLQSEPKKLLEVQSLTLQAPRSRNILFTDLTLEITNKDHLLVMGPSGSGKTSFLRALAGLWNSGSGTIIYYINGGRQPSDAAANESAKSIDNSLEAQDEELIQSSKYRRLGGIFFLPQKPYMVLGTLRQQLLYPTWTDDLLLSSDKPEKKGSLPFLSRGSNTNDAMEKPTMPTSDDLMKVLQSVRLGDILSRFKGLDAIYEWSSVLSLGEQQRLAFARLLLSKPKLVLLDESTSALDDENEAHLYRQIEQAGITYISIGHRKTLLKYHSRVLHIKKSNSDDIGSTSNWSVRPVSQTSEAIEETTSSA